jgi:Protein of unknown function (DUF3761)
MTIKLITTALLAFALVFQPAAQAQKSPPQDVPSSTTKKAEPSEADLQTHDHYTNKAGQAVHSPAKSKADKVPDGASAQCRDGTYSFSRSRRGTCSHHGGVAVWQ